MLPPPSPKYAHPHSSNPSHVASNNINSHNYNNHLHQSTSTRPNSTIAPVPTFVTALSTHASAAHYSRPMPPTNSQQQQGRAKGHSSEPSVVQLLAEQPSDRGGYISRLQQSQYGNRERDLMTANAPGVVSWRKGQGFKAWEKVRLESSEVRRKADVAQLCTSLLGFSYISKTNGAWNDSFLRPLFRSTHLHRGT